MSKQKIIEELNKYIYIDKTYQGIKLPNVESNKKTISVYDFLKMMENDFFGPQIELEKLLKSMHAYYEEIPSTSFFDKLLPKKNKQQTLIESCQVIEITNYEQKIEINLYKDEYARKKGGLTTGPDIKIKKRLTDNSTEFLCYNRGYVPMTNHENIDCFEAHLEQIEEIFAQQYYFTQVYGKYHAEYKQCNMLEKLVIKTELFKIFFHYYKSTKEIIPVIEINDEVIKTNRIYNKELKELLNLISENKDIILKKIPVKISELGYEYQNIINHQRKLSEQKQVVKTTKPYTRKRTIK